MADMMDKIKNVFGFNDNYDDEYYDEEEVTEEPKEAAPRAVKAKKPLDSLMSGDMIITVHEPLSYDESPRIVDDLRSHKAVVLNFEQLDIDVKREIFDFVSGALYAIDGKIQKVNSDIFVLAPNSIEIDGLKEELKNAGMFPW